MKDVRWLLIGLLVFGEQCSPAPELVFYIQRPPLEVLSSLKEDVSQKDLDAIKPSGFAVFYSGYIDYSNEDGKVAFPFTSGKKTPLQLIVTDQLRLFRISLNTIGYESVPKGARATLYTYKLKQDKNKFWFWNVRQKEVALGKALRKKPIILLTNPDNIFVGLGDFKASQPSANVMLPYNIYALSNKGNDRLNSDSLDMQRFFEPVETQIAVPAPSVSQKNITN